MIIAHYQKFIFIPIQKTGSTSVRDILSNKYNCVTPSSDNTSVLYNHTSAHRLKLFFQEQPYIPYKHPDDDGTWWKWDNYYKFTFVRNPYARLVSQYNYIRKIGTGSQTVSDPNCPGGTFTYPLKYYESCKRVAELKFNQFIKDSSMRVYWDVPYEWFGLDHFNFIGKTENLQRDFDHAIRIINKTNNCNIKSVKLPVSNKTTKEHYSEYYDKQSKQLVKDFYRNDLDRFNYKFEKG